MVFEAQGRHRSSAQPAAQSTVPGFRGNNDRHRTRSTHTANTDTPDSGSTRRARKAANTSIDLSSEDGEAVRLTKTGRVSKALKGQPVHKCEICSKCYTRAEHLRRHQATHEHEDEDEIQTAQLAVASGDSSTLDPHVQFDDLSPTLFDYSPAPTEATFGHGGQISGFYPIASLQAMDTLYAGFYDISDSTYYDQNQASMSSSDYATPSTGPYTPDLTDNPNDFSAIAHNDVSALWRARLANQANQYPSRSTSPASTAFFGAVPASSEVQPKILSLTDFELQDQHNNDKLEAEMARMAGMSIGIGQADLEAIWQGNDRFATL